MSSESAYGAALAMSDGDRPPCCGFMFAAHLVDSSRSAAMIASALARRALTFGKVS